MRARRAVHDAARRGCARPAVPAHRVPPRRRARGEVCAALARAARAPARGAARDASAQREGRAMTHAKLVLPTAIRLQEDTAESGGWSRFFDAALASLEDDE